MNSRARAIIQETAERHGVAPELIASSARARKVVQARWETVWRLRQEPSGFRDGPRWSYPQIAAFLGVDHTTVIFGERAYAAGRQPHQGRPRRQRVEGLA